MKIKDIKARIEKGLALLEECTICPRECRVNRLYQASLMYCSRSSVVVIRMGSIDLMRNGSMMVFIGCIPGVFEILQGQGGSVLDPAQGKARTG